MRWLAVHLPCFPLEVLSRGACSPGPLAVTDRDGGQTRVLIANAQARARGVRVGLSLGAARALAADLRLLGRDMEAEAAGLQRLACWAGQFTPLVSLAPPQGLLLEVAAGLRLFGGAQSLCTRVRDGLRRLGYQAWLALAPTPLGAHLLSRAGEETVVRGSEALRAAVAALPLEMLVLSPRRREVFQGMGLRRVADLLRLPREGLARRLGPQVVADLDRALGEAPDPRPRFTAPARFRSRLGLPAEVTDSQALLFAARRLLLELCGFLGAVHGGVRWLRWRFTGEQGEADRLHLELLCPSRDPDHLLELLRQRLEGLRLSAPVTALELVGGLVEPLAPDSSGLFREEEPVREHGRRLLERLQARLGEGRVRGLRLLEDHRPERAWGYGAPGEVSPIGYRRQRPLWLLPQPQALAVRDGWPWLQGRLELAPERERIEAGWWDAAGWARRDYFVARAASGERLWVFRELEGERRWFVHGIFC